MGREKVKITFEMVRNVPDKNSESNGTPKRQQSQDEEVSDTENDDWDTSCGIGGFRPKSLQYFSKPVFFMINFAVIGIIQGMCRTYLIGTLTTLEKRYAFPSKTSGLLLIADNISQMVVSPLIGYVALRYNRSRIIAIGESVVAMGCFVFAVPYFIYGPGVHLLHDDVTLAKNETDYQVCPADSVDHDCSVGRAHNTVWPAVIILWVASFIQGIGFTVFYTVGYPMLDDSAGKKNSPLFLSAATALRICGPAFGYMLSSFCLHLYEDPGYDSGITTADTRWVGAWWLGFLILGFLLLFSTLPMYCFPPEFKSQIKLRKEAQKSKRGFKESKSALLRLVSNPLLVFHTLGSTVRYIGLGGYYIFKPKYMESMYRQSSSSSAGLTGATSIVSMAIGIMAGGVAIARIKPKARSLLIYIFFVEMTTNLAIFVTMFLGCPPVQLPQTLVDNEGRLSLNADCNSGCDCTTRVFTPICSTDGQTTFFSPCYAGCKGVDRAGDVDTFADCSCLVKSGGSATAGYCPTDCNMLPYYLIVLSVGGLISSTARTGNSLIVLRAVEPRDKAFAMGVMSSFLAIFAFIPYPLIYGAITDAACVIWEESCGGTGNCWLYDQDKFRIYLHGATLILSTIGTLFDLGVIAAAGRMKNLYGDDEEDEKEEEGDEGEKTAMNTDVIVRSDGAVKVMLDKEEDR